MPGELSANHSPSAGTHDQQCSLGSVEGAYDFADKVLEARRVQQVDLVVAPGQVGNRSPDGDLSFDFLGLEIEGSVAGLGLAQPLDAAAREQHGFSQHGFAVVAVAQQRDVPDLLRVDSPHSSLP